MVRPERGRKTITFRDGIIETFEPKYRSIQKDCDRYFDALVDLSEAGIIETNKVIQLSGEGSLWIYYQYINKGLLDLVEAAVRRTVTSRDFFGPLFQNTQLILDRLIQMSEGDRVMTIYQAAIRHRLRALESEVAHWNKTRKTHSKNAVSKWIAHNLPPLKNMINDYKALLASIDRRDSKLEEFENALKTYETQLQYGP